MNYFSSAIQRITEEGNLRRIPSTDVNLVTVTDLSSNDYLGLALHQELQAEFYARPGVTSIPMTSSASRLLSGQQEHYASLEALLSRLYKRPALLFNSGYHANTGMVAAIAQCSKTLIVADKLVHASIIDGMVLSKAPFARFTHNDLAHLERIIEKEYDKYDTLLVVVESVYSMDGDKADIDGLVEVKKRYPKVILYVDEAHAFGVEGPKGLGLSYASPGYDSVDIIVGTFGKACASMGAFCAASSELHDYLVNRARSFIFSTALPPINVAWTEFLIEKFIAMDEEREHLRSLGRRLCDILTPLSGDFPVTPSHIQPYVTGSPSKAVELSHRLRENGFKVLPIRVPTVPPGTDRLRISLNASLTIDDIDRFGHVLKHSI